MFHMHNADATATAVGGVHNPDYLMTQFLCVTVTHANVLRICHVIVNSGYC